MGDHILVVDDEKEIADLIEFYLKNEGFSVHKFYLAADALDCIKTNTLDMAILDIMLPDGNGFDICRVIREHGTYPVIMLSAKGEEIDKITGLTIGADDYMTKPFRPLELVARVKAQLRRYKKYSMNSAAADSVIIYKGLIMDVNIHECTLNEKPLALTPTEFSILRILCEKNGAVVSAEELFHHIWGEECYIKNNNTITVHIRHLREKMGDSTENPQYIKTVWGVGYKIEK